MVARLVRDQKVTGSNPATSTRRKARKHGVSGLFCCLNSGRISLKSHYIPFTGSQSALHTLPYGQQMWSSYDGENVCEYEYSNEKYARKHMAWEQCRTELYGNGHDKYERRSPENLIIRSLIFGIQLLPPACLPAYQMMSVMKQALQKQQRGHEGEETEWIRI